MIPAVLAQIVIFLAALAGLAYWSVEQTKKDKQKDTLNFQEFLRSVRPKKPTDEKQIPLALTSQSR